MQFDEFKKLTTVLDANQSAEWRLKYIEAFVDTSSAFYRKNIAARKPCSDGNFYGGYLWDCVKNLIAMSFDEFRAEVERVDHAVMVMWDLHSSEKIPVPGYWRFGKSDILSLDPKRLLQNLEYLPEDIYVFDHDLTWTLIATHEYRSDDSRICAGAAKIKS